MLELILTGATAPAPAIIQAYRPISGTASFPPTLSDLGRSIIPIGGQTSTSPNGAGYVKPFLILRTDNGQQVVVPKVSISDKEDNSSNALSAQESLNNIKEDLALSVTQLAEMFEVTRKAVYDWYDGAAPRIATVTKINALVDVLASTPKDLDVKRLKFIWKIPVEDKSFLTVLNDEKLDAENLRQALRDKLHQLSSRLASPPSKPVRTSEGLGRAHLADIERDGDFS
jgi:DNA-binding transcriptional regulator YiaG